MFLLCFSGYLYLMGLLMQFIVMSLQPYCVKFILTSHKQFVQCAIPGIYQVWRQSYKENLGGFK